MKTSRRTFLGAAIAGLTYPVCATGKVVAKEPDIEWKWILSPWECGSRKWSAIVELKCSDAERILECVATTNQRAFCGIRKDCLLFSELALANTNSGKAAVMVSLTECRWACGNITTATIRSHAKTLTIRCRRACERTNFQEIMPGRHTVVPAQGVDHTAWIEPDQAVLDAIKKHQADGKSRPGDNYHFNVAFDL